MYLLEIWGYCNVNLITMYTYCTNNKPTIKKKLCSFTRKDVCSKLELLSSSKNYPSCRPKKKKDIPMGR